MLSDFRKNRNKSALSPLAFKVGGVLVLALILLLVVANLKIYRKKQQLNSQIENLENKIRNLKGENSNLMEGISSSDDEEYIEKIAREELNLQKPGEKTVSFVVSQNQESQNGNAKKNVFQSWLEWLGSLFDK